MLRINKKMEYGLIALLYLNSKELLSRTTEQSESNGRPSAVASVREIAKKYGISEPLLGKIMQNLRAQNLVSVVHGNQGGYRLTKDINGISLLELNDALQGPLRVTSCLESTGRECPVHGHCPITGPMEVLNRKITQLFESTTVRNLFQQGEA